MITVLSALAPIDYRELLLCIRLWKFSTGWPRIINKIILTLAKIVVFIILVPRVLAYTPVAQYLIVRLTPFLIWSINTVINISDVDLNHICPYNDAKILYI